MPSKRKWDAANHVDPVTRSQVYNRWNEQLRCLSLPAYYDPSLLAFDNMSQWEWDGLKPGDQQKIISWRLMCRPHQDAYRFGKPRGLPECDRPAKRQCFDQTSQWSTSQEDTINEIRKDTVALHERMDELMDAVESQETSKPDSIRGLIASNIQLIQTNAKLANQLKEMEAKLSTSSATNSTIVSTTDTEGDSINLLL